MLFIFFFPYDTSAFCIFRALQFIMNWQPLGLLSEAWNYSSSNNHVGQLKQDNNRQQHHALQQR